MHDVERGDGGEHADEHRRDDGEILGDVVRDAEGRERAAGDEELLADLDDLEQLRGVGIEVDHVAGLLGGLRAGVHGDADVGLGEGGRVVGPVAGHGDEVAGSLLLADAGELHLGRRLGEEIIHPGLGGDGGGGQGVVASDHDGADAHGAELGEALLDAALDDVLEKDDAERLGALGDDEGGAALAGDAVNGRGDRGRKGAALGLDPRLDAGGRALADDAGGLAAGGGEVDTAHAGLGGEGHEDGRGGGEVAAAEAEFILGEHDDAAALGGLVGEGSKLGGIGELLAGDAGGGEEVGGLAVAERDGAGLVEEKHVDVARGLDGAAGGGEDVALQEAVHARDADRAEQAADGGGNQADQQRDQRRERKGDARVGAEGLEGDDDEDEDERERGEQDRERDLVGRLLAGRALDKADHVVEEALAGIGRDADEERVREHARAAGHGAAVAAGLADDRGGFPGDGGFVDGRGALDDLAVARDDLAGLDEDDVALGELGRVNGLERAVLAAAAGDELLARSAEGAGLGLATALGDGLGEVRKNDREEQPEGDLEDVAERILRGEELLEGEDRADERDKHHRVLELLARVELLEGVGRGGEHDFAVKKGDGFGAHGGEKEGLLEVEVRKSGPEEGGLFRLS